MHDMVQHLYCRLRLFTDIATYRLNWPIQWKKEDKFCIQETLTLSTFANRSTNSKKHNENCKTLHRKHLIRCWVVNLFLLKYSSKDLSYIEFCHNLTFWVVTIWFFEFSHNLTFWVLSQLEFLSYVTIWLYLNLSGYFGQNSSLCVLSQLEF